MATSEHPITRSELREELRHYATKEDLANLKWQLAVFPGCSGQRPSRHSRVSGIRSDIMRQDLTALWMGLFVFVAGLLLLASAWIGDFSWARVLYGGIPTALGGLLMLKRA